MAERSGPPGDRARWQRRAELFAYLRQFFGERGVLEVDTPVLGRLGMTDPALEAPAAEGGSLQTSPEYFMKRLLAAGSDLSISWPGPFAVAKWVGATIRNFYCSSGIGRGGTMRPYEGNGCAPGAAPSRLSCGASSLRRPAQAGIRACLA